MSLESRDRDVVMQQGMLSRRAALSVLCLLVPQAAWAQGSLLEQGRGLLQQVPAAGAPKAAGSTSRLSQGEVASGLREALSVASRRVVGRVGTANGYNGDPAIRIPLPDTLQKLAGPLRALGGGGMLDDLQLKMNRAAEQAAPKALDIFTSAISRMTIGDAQAILSGPQDAATQYFKRETSASLTAAFRPIVDRALSDVGAVTAFKGVQSQASSIPMAGREVQAFNLTDFTVGKALDGLFHYLGTEEAAIRTNPGARSTDLLKKVFG